MCAKYRIPPSMIGGRTYFCDDEGFVLNRAGKRLKPWCGQAMRANPNTHGGTCAAVNLGKVHRVHRLNCAARWGKPKSGQECHHLNGNMYDNRPDNLIWLYPDRHRFYHQRLRALKERLGSAALHYTRKEYIRLTRLGDAHFQAELDKRARLNGILKKIGRNPETIPADELEKLYSRYGFRTPNEPHPVDWDLTHHCEY